MLAFSSEIIMINENTETQQDNLFRRKTHLPNSIHNPQDLETGNMKFELAMMLV